MDSLSLEQLKIKEFVDWYSNEAINYSTTEIGEFFPAIDMEKLINKLAVWYDFKYNSDVIDKIENPNIDIFNHSVLLQSLPWYERFYLLPTRYVNMFKIIFNNSVFNVNLDSDGFVIDDFVNRMLPKELRGIHICDFKSYVTLLDVDITMVGLEEAINNHEIQKKIKAGLIESVVMRIIDTDKKDGLRRAFYVVKEYEVDPTILILHATLNEDKYMMERINEYLEEYKLKNLKKV